MSETNTARWRPLIDAATAGTAVDPILVEAVMAVESAGVNLPPNSAKAAGLMQIVPSVWPEALQAARAALNLPAASPDELVVMPEVNVRAAVRILAYLRSQHGDWDTAVRAYHGFGSDGISTDRQYLAWVTAAKVRIAAERSGGGTMPSEGNAVATANLRIRRAPKRDADALGTLASGAAVPLAGAITDGWAPVGGPVPGFCFAGFLRAAAVRFDGRFGKITGGKGRVSQPFGNIPGGAIGDMYDYVTSYGLDPGMHGGIDVGLPEGTPLFAPMAGRVVCEGTGKGSEGCAAFADDEGGAGRIELALDNGDRLVLGHCRTSAVRTGARVEAGTKVGTSGTAGTGGHVHVELRMRSADTAIGQVLVDPALRLDAGVTPAPVPSPPPVPQPEPPKGEWPKSWAGTLTVEEDGRATFVPEAARKDGP